MSKFSIFPVGKKVLLSLEKTDVTPEGIYLVGNLIEKFGTVVAIGDLVKTLDIEDKVLLPVSYRLFSFEGFDYAIVDEKDLDIVIRDDE